MQISFELNNKNLWFEQTMERMGVMINFFGERRGSLSFELKTPYVEKYLVKRLCGIAFDLLATTLEVSQI